MDRGAFTARASNAQPTARPTRRAHTFTILDTSLDRLRDHNDTRYGECGEAQGRQRCRRRWRRSFSEATERPGTCSLQWLQLHRRPWDEGVRGVSVAMRLVPGRGTRDNDQPAGPLRVSRNTTRTADDAYANRSRRIISGYRERLLTMYPARAGRDAHSSRDDRVHDNPGLEVP